MHSDKGPAIEWQDGYKLYYLNGVKFPEDLWEKVTSRKITWKEITKIQDIDQRTQAMAFANVDDFISTGKIVSEISKETLEGKKVNYRLLHIPQGTFIVDAYFSIYDCPSTDQKYISGIDPEIGKEKDIIKAMAWKHWTTPEEWNKSIPLLDES